MAEDREVVVVGAGIAGLVAAHELRDLAPLVLEAGDRVGGRILSDRRGELGLSVGAHMFPSSQSVTGRLADAHGLTLLPIRGLLLNMEVGGRLIRNFRPALLPFRLPLSFRGRLSTARAGAKITWDSRRYARLIRSRTGDTAAAIRLRGLRYGGDRSFADFLGPVHPETNSIFQALTNRAAAEPSEISQSAMAAFFAHVGGLGRNVLGGAGLLPEALAASLGDAIRLRSRVEEIRLHGGGVRVVYADDAGVHEVSARSAIVAAPHAEQFVADPPPEVADALARLRFGPIVIVSVLTDETEPMPWDDLYSILTPQRRFSIAFNLANSLYDGSRSKQGSVLMMSGGGDRARAFDDRSDDDIRNAYLSDLQEMFPQVSGRIVDAKVHRWPTAAPFAAPGRWRAQEALERGVGSRIFFAGDWVSDFVGVETAAATAVDAAAQARLVAMR
jgi:protoporphyrinogen/coproporphyrinogen III oxidase